MKSYWFNSLRCLLNLTFLFCLTSSAYAQLESVSVQLKWKHQFQFAGFYMALEKGYYKDVGLDVKLIEGGPEKSAVNHVVNETSAYGVTSTGALLERSQGKAVKALGAIFQHSPLALLVLKKKGLEKISDLRKKRVMLQTGYQNVDIIAALRKAGLSEREFFRQNISYNIQDLITGKTDAYSAYVTDQPYQLEQLGIPYRIFHPNEHGIDFYGDIIITSDHEIDTHPERVERFMKATAQGWNDALENQEEAVDLILLKYNTQKLSREQLLFEARESSKLIMQDVVNIGYMNNYRWQQIANVYAKQNFLSPDYPVSEFVYQPKTRIITLLQEKLWQIVVIILLLVLAVLGLNIVMLRRMVRTRSRELVAQNKELNETQAIAHLGGWELNLLTNKLSWSEEVFHIFELDSVHFEPSYEAFLDVIHPDDREAVGQAYSNSLKTRESYSIEHRLLMKDGRVKWVHEQCESWFDEEGNPLRSHGTVQDITEYKEAEQALIESEDRLKASQRVAHLGHYSLNIKKGVWTASDELCAVFGIERERREKTLELWLEITHPNSRDVLWDYLQNKVLTEYQDFDKEYKILALDSKQEKWVHGLGSLKFDEKGEPIEMFGTIQDITEHKKVEQDLIEAKELAESANQSKGRFLAMMSHEIRTPLNGIMGLTELVLASKLTKKQHEQLQTVRASGMILLTVLGDVLDFSKMEAKQLELSVNEFSVSGTIEHVVKLYTQNARSKGIDLVLKELPKLSYCLLGDSDRLQQVLMNLISNAIKFTDKGEVSLYSYIIEENIKTAILRFEVHDTGIGISDEGQEKLFTAFSQLDTSHTRQHGGTGLGLTIAQRLVHLMGGEIIMVSVLGQGSRFWFELEFEKGGMLRKIQPPPRNEEAGYEEKSEHEEGGFFTEVEAEPVQRSEKILLVEDVIVNQQVALGMLGNMGFENVDVSNNGLEAVESFACGKYALILMDIQMPLMDGYAATQKIRSIEKKQECAAFTPIVALTAHAFAEEKKKSLAMGMNDLITKPLTGDSLRVTLNEWLPHSAASLVEEPQSPVQKPEEMKEDVPETSILDVKTLKRLHRDMGGSIEVIMDLYTEALPNQIQSICDALEEKDSETLRITAHKLKSTSRSFGALALGELCADLESQSKDMAAIDLDQIIQALEEEKVAVLQALTEPWVTELR